jgi:hypothetical protein
MSVGLKFLGTIVIFASLGLLSSCGKKSKVDDNLPVISSLGLVGEWRQNCYQEVWFGAQGRIDEFRFDVDKEFQRKVTFFKDDGCSEPIGVLETKGDMNEGEEIADGNGVREINFTVKEMTFKPQSDFITAALNTVSYCGISDWTVGNSVDLLGNDCGGTSIDRNESSYNIFKIDDERLYFGSTSLWLRQGDAAERPTDLELQHEFTLVKRL